MIKGIYTVAWTMDSDAIIKLVETNKTYDVDEKADAYLKKADLYSKLDDKKVEVEIDETKASGDESCSAGLITRLTLVDNEPTKANPKEEPKKEKEDKPNVETNLVTKEIHVGGVSVQKKTLIDKNTDTWYDVDSTIDIHKCKQECTKKTIEITVAPQEKGNDVIKSYVLKDEDKKDEPKEEIKSNGKDDFYKIKRLENKIEFLESQKSDSFEAQKAVESANEVVAQMKDILKDPEKVLSTIKTIAMKNFEIIQKLKNKE